MYSVTINYHCNYGYIEYDEVKKIATVKLLVPDAKKAVEDFLAKPLTLDVPQGATIRDFVTKTLDPLASLDNFQTCLTRLWGKTSVRVEWSMPPGIAEKL